MSQLASLLDDRFGINHFWYYKIYLNGHYSYVGSHQEWDEYCYDTLCVKHFAYLRHPECLHKGLYFMRATTDKAYKNVLDVAWKKFNINFNLNLANIVSDGIEAVGFATRFNDSQAEERLITHLPILQKLTNEFKIENPEFFHRMRDQLVYLPNELKKYYECPKILIVPFVNNEIMSLKEFNKILSLTSREKDALKLIARGYPSDFMAAKLGVRVETVENYLSSVKYKLSCDSIHDLIKKAHQIEKSNYFEL